tara:strand:- start:11 stop:217 length:207 start_codon:yes stop_codon:yes gene_type:complete
MKDVNELNIEIERIKGDIRLIHQSLDVIKNNHLAHLQKDITKLNRIVWTVGIMIFSQMVLTLKDYILG